jgi:excisionase family DNA binding protein
VVTDRDRSVVRWVGVIGAVSVREIMARFGVGRTVAYRRLAALVEHGLLSRPHEPPLGRPMNRPNDNHVPPLDTPLLTPAEAAQLLALRPSWIYEAVRTGTLPCLRLDRHIRFTRPMLEDWLRGRVA